MTAPIDKVPNCLIEGGCETVMNIPSQVDEALGRDILDMYGNNIFIRFD